MKLKWDSYHDVAATWPDEGEVILASFDENEIVVYQAYKPSIADFAVKNQKFGGEFSFSRMTWIKPNFLWMMYRSGWAQKQDQERILAISLRLDGFEEILKNAEYSSFQPEIHDSEDDWRRGLNSDVRMQWDPDHDPNGRAMERRAIQLGIRGKTLREMNEKWIVEIDDVTDLVTANRVYLPNLGGLQVPHERIFIP